MAKRLSFLQSYKNPHSASFGVIPSFLSSGIFFDIKNGHEQTAPCCQFSVRR
ncbi:hypothetical protein BAP_2271 [Bacillus sp. CN2]|nr:hypothetical protein BAP_2271 [Bacillus sp. CN2]